MAKRAVVSAELPKPAGPYSHVVEVNGVAFTAGFGAQDPATGEVPSGITAQTSATIDNIERALRAVGLGLADVVKSTVHLADIGDFAAFNAVYAARFPEPYPVRTTVQSGLMGILVEIDVVALRSDG